MHQSESGRGGSGRGSLQKCMGVEVGEEGRGGGRGEGRKWVGWLADVGAGATAGWGGLIIIIKSFLNMDYEDLYRLLPKSHWQWTVKDTLEWLNYIGLQSLRAKFQESSVDGSILTGLTEQDLVAQLQVTSKIILKKLMNWIRNGLPEFERLVNSKNERMEESIKLRTNKMSLPQQNRPVFPEEKIKEERCNSREVSTEHPKRYEANELIIKNIEQNQSNYFLKEKGGMIGRQASNEIVIMDEFVSRHHAEIIYQREQYFIRDCGSSSGTFLKIFEKMELKRGMIIEMGSNQFEVSIDQMGGCTVYVIDGPNQEYIKELVGSEVYSFGRKQSNFVSFPDDQHLSGIHSKIFKIKGKWFIEDIATTNGTWLRLSREGEESEAFLLEDKCQFKLSSNLIYECKLNTNNRKTNKNSEEKCLVCKTMQKDAIIMPCKHAVGCWECLSAKKECPICDTPINNIIKIFTA